MLHDKISLLEQILLSKYRFSFKTFDVCKVMTNHHFSCKASYATIERILFSTELDCSDTCLCSTNLTKVKIILRNTFIISTNTSNRMFAAEKLFEAYNVTASDSTKEIYTKGFMKGYELCRMDMESILLQEKYNRCEPKMLSMARRLER